MPRSIPALIKPELLVWAREASGLTQEDIASKLQKPIEKLALWESGDDYPTIPQLRKLAKLYRRPLAVFYLPHPPKETNPLHDFRKVGPTQSPEYSSDLRFLIRDAQQRRDTAIELAEDLGEIPDPFPINSSIQSSPDKVANQIRSTLDISYDEQTHWKTPYEALKRWIQAIEYFGILVFQSGSVPNNEMRGFSIVEHPFPIVMLNSKDSPRGRIFTLMHELTHVALRNGGVCDLEESVLSSPNHQTINQKIEVFCNYVAGAILVPQAHLIRESIVQSTQNDNFSMGDLEDLAKHYQVSKEVILRRLLIVGKVSQHFYQVKRQELFNDYQQKVAEKSSGGPPVFRRTLAKNGYAFSRLVLDAYNGDRITTSEVSAHLDMKLQHLPQLEEAL